METTTTTKVCCKCKRELPVEEFYKNKKMKDGLQSYCKQCQVDYSRQSHSKGKVAPPLFAKSQICR